MSLIDEVSPEIQRMLEDIAAGRSDGARMQASAEAMVRSAELWHDKGTQLVDGYRHATWGDPNFAARDNNVVGAGAKASEIAWDQSQIVATRPHWCIYRHVALPNGGRGFGLSAMQKRPVQEQYVRTKGGVYFGSETDGARIALEVLEKHAHEEAIEPVRCRIDVIEIRLPDGGLRVFVRDGATGLRELRVEQPRGIIITGMGLPPEKAA